jgi:hypothetical protein
VTQYDDRVMIDATSCYTYRESGIDPPRVGVIDDSLRFHRRRNPGIPQHYIDGDDTVMGESMWKDYDNINPKNSHVPDLIRTEVSRHHYFLCPKKIVGFVLKSRIWGKSVW